MRSGGLTSDEATLLEHHVLFFWMMALLVTVLAMMLQEPMAGIMATVPAGLSKYIPLLSAIMASFAMLQTARLWLPGSLFLQHALTPDTELLRNAEAKLSRRQSWALGAFGPVGLPMAVMVFGHQFDSDPTTLGSLVFFALFGWIVGEVRWSLRQGAEQPG